MQVKFFKETEIAELEAAVNEWLEKFKGEVLNVIPYAIGHPREHTFLAAVCYEGKASTEKKPAKEAPGK